MAIETFTYVMAKKISTFHITDIFGRYITTSNRSAKLLAINTSHKCHLMQLRFCISQKKPCPLPFSQEIRMSLSRLPDDSVELASPSASMTTPVAVRLLKAIAQETRLKIIEVLLDDTSSGLPAGVIAASLDVSPNLISFHLKELFNSEILLRTISGRNIIYSINPEIMESFFSYLMKYRTQPTQ